MLILNIDTVKGLKKKNVLNFEDQDYNLVHLDFKYTQFRSKKNICTHIKNHFKYQRNE